MTKSGFKIIGFEQCDVFQLAPHPAALVPIDDADRSAIEQGIDEVGGLLNPLIVENAWHDSKDANEGRVRYVLDGCNRLEVIQRKAAAFHQGASVPCILVTADDPRAVALTCLMAKRKGSTGQRVLAHIEMHKAEVLTAYKGNGGRPEKTASREAVYTAEAIAERLKCSRDDVSKGIELMLELLNEKDAKRAEILKEARDSILCGGGSIRRWRPAVGGKLATKNRERADVDYGHLIKRGAVSLCNGLLHESECVGDVRELALEAWSKICDRLPSDFIEILIGSFASWRLSDQLRVEKTIKSVLAEK